MKKNASLGKIFVMAFTFFMILPVTAVFLTFLVTIFEANREKVSQDLQVVSHAVAGQVNTGLENPAMYLVSLAEVLAEGEGQGIDILIRSGINNFPIFDSIYILDRDAKVRMMSFSNVTGYNISDFIGIKLSDVKGFADFEHYWSRPFLSPVSNSYVVRLSVMYPGGFVVGDLNMEFLMDTLLHAEMVDDSNVFVVDTNGDVISSSRYRDYMVHENLFNHPVVREAYHGGHIVFNYSHKGVRYAGSGFKIPVTDWYLVLEQKEKSAFTLFYDLFFVTLAAGGVIILFIAAVLYIVKKRIISPIRHLTEKTEQLSAGTFSELEFKDRNSFEELQKLCHSYQNMSMKIAEREKELREKEEYTRSIFDSTANTGIMVLSAGDEPVITDANLGAELISGYRMSELIGLHPAALVSGVGDDITRMKNEALEKNSMVTGRFNMTKKNGIGFPVLCTVHPLNQRARSGAAFIVVFIDITELTRIQNALESEKERLDVTLKSLGEGVLATDNSGRVILANSSSEKILGQKYKYVVGRSIGDVLRIYDFSTGEDLSDELVSSRDTSKRTFRANLVSDNAGVINVMITATPMKNSNGFIVGFVYVFRDITERMMMEKELLERKKQLEEINRNLEIRVTEETEKRRKNEQLLFEQAKFAAMGQMISAIAHQWRQPLNALALYTQDIEDAYDLGEVNSVYLRSFVSNSMSLIQHMSGTIDDFRNFFHSSNIKEEVNLLNVVCQALSLVTTQLRNQNINFEICLDSGLKKDVFANSMPPKGSVYGKNIRIFPSEMKQVILNILQNARDAISEKRLKTNKDTGNIIINIEYRPEKVVLEIANDGGRIPRENLVRIFDPYYTTKPEGEGTGIGLYMSKIMIEDHMGGLLMAENMEDGARFVITIYYDQ